MVGSCTSDRGARAAPVRNRWAPRLAQLPAGQMQYEDGGTGGQTGLGQSKRQVGGVASGSCFRTCYPGSQAEKVGRSLCTAGEILDSGLSYTVVFKKRRALK